MKAHSIENQYNMMIYNSVVRDTALPDLVVLLGVVPYVAIAASNVISTICVYAYIYIYIYIHRYVHIYIYMIICVKI